jgi:hypothetical protein
MKMEDVPAGPALDRLVAERVMGQEHAGECGLGDADCPGQFRPVVGRWGCLPPYSTDIAAAWEVVERVVAEGGYVRLDYDRDYGGEHRRGWTFALNGSANWQEFLPTAAEAICRSALKDAGFRED